MLPKKKNYYFFIVEHADEINASQHASPPNWKEIQIKKLQKVPRKTGRTDGRTYYTDTQGI